MRLVPGLLVLAAGHSCTSSPLPQATRPDCGSVTSSSGDGRVLFSSFDQLDHAARVALAIDEHFDRTAEELGYRRDEPLEVWLDPEWHTHGSAGARCIVVNPSGRRMEFVDLILAHELVHWHARGTPIQRNLPLVVGEGIAERIALDIVREYEADRRAVYGDLLDAARRRGDLPDLISRANLDEYGWHSLPPESSRHELYALGFALVNRIGVDALREAATRGPVTLEATLRMAGVSPDGTGL